MKKKETVKPPNPGSDAAIDAGCNCAVFDNCHGAGFKYGGKVCFWINAECPLHGLDRKGEEE